MDDAETKTPNTDSEEPATDSVDTTSDKSNSVAEGNDSVSVSDSKEIKPDDSDENLTRWGWFSYRPNWLQVFNVPPWLCTCLSSLYFVQAMVMWGFLFVSLSTIEKRFNLSSTAVGVIVASYDIWAAIFVLFVCYYSNYSSKSRILAVGCFGMGLGSFIFMLPHFISDPYMYSDVNASETLCKPTENATDPCLDEDWEPSYLSYYFIVFLIAQFFHGVGGTPVYTVSPVYMDENISEKSSATYMGIMYSMSCIGPAVGFILGGYFLTIYTDIRYADSVTITPEDPAWVGAWWLGFLIGWLLAWLIAGPLGGFPRELPIQAELRDEKRSQVHKSKSQIQAAQPDFGTSFRDFPKAFWLLCKNPAYIFTILAASSALLIVVGFAAFLPKFIENQLNQTSGAAAVMLGITFVPGAAGGSFLGGWIVKKFDMKVKGMMIFIIVMSVAVALLALIFMIRCPEEPLAGVFVPYEPNGTDAAEVELTVVCNEDCGCSTEMYSPVCGSNELQYFDSCYAGCLQYNADQERYYDCRCVWNETWLSRDERGYADAKKCDTNCESWKLPVFLFLLFVVMVFVFCRTVPGVTIEMRLVPENQRPFAMGIGSLCAKLLGGVPGPIIFGAAIDKSCVLWHYECGQRGACWVYDPLEFSFRLTMLGVVFSIVGIICMVLAYAFYKPPDSVEAETIGVSENELRDMTGSGGTGESSRAPPGVQLIGYTPQSQTTVAGVNENGDTNLKTIVREDSQAVLVESEIWGDL